MEVVIQLLGMSRRCLGIRVTWRALRITSAVRFWPWGSLGMVMMWKVQEHQEHKRLKGDGSP